jgi:hypothetical protein
MTKRMLWILRKPSENLGHIDLEWSKQRYGLFFLFPYPSYIVLSSKQNSFMIVSTCSLKDLKTVICSCAHTRVIVTSLLN